MKDTMIKINDELVVTAQEVVESIASYLYSGIGSYDNIAKILSDLQENDFHVVINEMASNKCGMFHHQAFYNFIQELEKSNIISVDRLNFAKSTDKYKSYKEILSIEETQKNKNYVPEIKNQSKKYTFENDISLELIIKANREADKSFGGWLWVDIVSVLTVPTIIIPVGLIGAKCYFENKAYKKVIYQNSKESLLNKHKNDQKRVVGVT